MQGTARQDWAAQSYNTTYRRGRNMVISTVISAPKRHMLTIISILWGFTLATSLALNVHSALKKLTWEDE
jgi:hypothetical protein